MPQPTKAELQEENEVLRRTLDDVQELVADALEDPDTEAAEDADDDE